MHIKPQLLEVPCQGEKEDRHRDKVKGLGSQRQTLGHWVLSPHPGRARVLCRWSKGLQQRLAGLTFLVLLLLLLGDSIFMVWAQAHMQEKSRAAAEVQRPHSSSGHTNS